MKHASTLPVASDTAPERDALTRVDAACARSGLGSWLDVVEAARGGAVFNIEFAQRRPADFVKGFAALLRAQGLALKADNALELFLGTPVALEETVNRQPPAATRALSGLGEVEPGEADTVTVSAASRSAGVHYERRERHYPLKGYTALLLDDDLVSRKVIEAQLRRARCDVKVAADAETAFALLKQLKPDVVVLDIMLGGAIDGFAFYEVLRASDACRDIPAVFVTGTPQADTHARAVRIPASAYFEKPVGSAQLYSTIAGLVSGGTVAPASRMVR
jgi:CheY-like chemotaxis protein